ncbi:MAG TPA: hypothetical protein VLM80_07250 [Anaerolineales bacterium]|nr:hypothetical protein [Anaerolineales bacterium]
MTKKSSRFGLSANLALGRSPVQRMYMRTSMTFMLLTSGIGWIMMLTKMHGNNPKAQSEGKNG